jgi:hypothetical protein
VAAACATVALLAASAAAVGVFARGDGSIATVTSERGETYDMATTGVYAYNAQRVVAEGVGWDVFTLLVAAPALLLAAAFVARGSARARLAAIGLLGYFVYLYLEYAVTWAFGPLFPVFVIALAMSVASLAWLASSRDTAALVGHFGEGFPRGSWVALSITMSLLLAIMWAGRIAQGLDSVDGVLLGHTTMTVQALDLGLVIPVTLIVALLVWRRSEAGHVVGAAFAVMFVTLSAAIVAMLVSAGFVEGTFELPPIAIFGGATALAALLAVRMYRSLGAPARVESRDAMASASVLPRAAGPSV